MTDPAQLTEEQAKTWAWEVIDYVRRSLHRDPGSPDAWEVTDVELRKTLEATPDGVVGKAVGLSYRYRQGGDYAGTTFEAVVETFLWAGWKRAGETLRFDRADAIGGESWTL